MAEEQKYRIVRIFSRSGRRFVIKHSLSLVLAEEHCNNPETSSVNCTKPENRRRTRRSGPWMDVREKI